MRDRKIDSHRRLHVRGGGSRRGNHVLIIAVLGGDGICLLVTENIRGDIADDAREVPRAEFAEVPIAAGGAKSTGLSVMILRVQRMMVVDEENEVV